MPPPWVKVQKSSYPPEKELALMQTDTFVYVLTQRALLKLFLRPYSVSRDLCRANHETQKLTGLSYCCVPGDGAFLRRSFSR